MQSNPQKEFGLIVIGDEVLFGQREDRHLAHFRSLLKARGQQLTRCWLLSDDAAMLTEHLRFSLQRPLPVFVCGGIGATPDDLTRACAAEAAGLSLTRHPEAAALIEARFGEEAYPIRIRMADLPEGSRLIPNPYNQIAGFSIGHHHFLPGFPEMAWPMAAWVLDNHYPAGIAALVEASFEILGTAESRLVPIMEAMEGRFPGLKLYSLPRLGADGSIELGMRGEGEIDSAMQQLAAALQAAGITFR
jgi:molybdopterin-biosynthesis enzyme MoeA-like protein